MVRKQLLSIVFSLIIGVLCFRLGTGLSHQRPLWNDELYTQVNTIEPLGYADLWAGKAVEGNNGPLFYVLQKALCQRLGYVFPGKWNGEWFVQDDGSQVLLRIASNVFMSGAIALVFYGFASFFSIGWGFLAVAFLLSLPATWLYWVEARPYSLWILLSVVQALFFLRTIGDRDTGKSWLGFGLTNMLLSLTIVFGAVQSCAASFILACFDPRRWRRYLVCAGVPVAFGAFYMQRSPQFKYWFNDGPVKLILDNVPPEYWVMLIFYLCFVLILKMPKRDEEKITWCDHGYGFLAALISVAAFAILGLLRWKAGAGPEGFAISSRYFLFLVPTVVMAVVLGVRHIHESFRGDPWLRLDLWVVVLGLLILRSAKTYIFLWGSGTFMHLIR